MKRRYGWQMDHQKTHAPYAILRHLTSTLQRTVRASGRMAVDMLLPPRCLSCSEPLDRHGALCSECWPQMRWLRAPWCECCGLPFAHGLGQGALCGGCLAKAPKFASARSALAYDKGSNRMVARFKYQDATLLAPVLGEWMLRAGGEVLNGVEVIVPVPLHWRRLLWRRFNQAALLAGEIRRHTAIPLLANGLQRTRHTRPQASLTREQRKKNVRGLFRVRPSQRTALSGKIVLLVDDVHTTGATLEACSRALLRAGAKEVRCLTLARTLYDTMQPPIPKEEGVSA
jgi:ComF family protein